jgi:sugar/nucleoside kinase (ribokinase family)
MLNQEWHNHDHKMITEELLRDISGQLLDYGAGIVILKLGEQGLYLRTSSEGSVIDNISMFSQDEAEQWTDREILSPCYLTEVAGTTGAGDCTIAGFLAGLIHGQTPAAATKSAVGVGAFNVEKPDSVSGIPDWKTVQNRIGSGWQILENSIELKNLSWNDEWQIWK